MNSELYADSKAADRLAKELLTKSYVEKSVKKWIFPAFIKLLSEILTNFGTFFTIISYPSAKFLI